MFLFVVLHWSSVARSKQNEVVNQRLSPLKEQKAQQESPSDWQRVKSNHPQGQFIRWPVELVLTNEDKWMLHTCLLVQAGTRSLKHAQGPLAKGHWSFKAGVPRMFPLWMDKTHW